MTKKFLIGLIVCFISLTEGVAAEQRVSLAMVSWLPFAGRFLPNYGIASEVISEAFARKGYQVSFNFMAWTKSLREVEKGNYDAAANAYYTEERARIYLPSDPYMECPMVFFKRKDSPISWTGLLEELKPYKIGVVKGYANSPKFDHADFLQKKVSKTEMLNMKKLILKQADLIVTDLFSGGYLISEKLPDHEKNMIEPISPPLYVNKLHLMFSRKVPDAQQKLDAFNSGLKEIIKDGTLKKILGKYMFDK